ncbi:hypothetical protein O3P69_017396 [Scylla paramamosain]|uniref:Uncharacterized protein n=1 Tax=Scylla paramamosain TaxID=85552 RepID=A0AAW0SDP7_SCYPA
MYLVVADLQVIGYNVEINDITTKPRVYCEPFQRCSMKGEDEEIEALKRKRAVAKGKFTRKGNLFTTAHGDEAPVVVQQGLVSFP